MDVLHAACSDSIDRRKVKVNGANALDPPVKPAPPRL
jgi:gluconolactonase